MRRIEIKSSVDERFEEFRMRDKAFRTRKPDKE